MPGNATGGASGEVEFVNEEVILFHNDCHCHAGATEQESQVG